MVILAQLLCVLSIGFGIALLIKPVLLKQRISIMLGSIIGYPTNEGGLVKTPIQFEIIR